MVGSRTDTYSLTLSLTVAYSGKPYARNWGSRNECGSQVRLRWQMDWTWQCWDSMHRSLCLSHETVLRGTEAGIAVPCQVPFIHCFLYNKASSSSAFGQRQGKEHGGASGRVSMVGKEAAHITSSPLERAESFGQTTLQERLGSSLAQG
jgi:hypothetical protein